MPPPETKLAKFDYNRPPADGVNGLQRMAGPLLAQINAAIPAVMEKNAERFVRALMTECQKTPALLDCSPKSLFGGVIQVAALGLELGGPAGQAYLLPFKGEATLCIGYRGFITLAFRAGVHNFTPRTVREGDIFDIHYGTRNELIHAPKFPIDGEVTGYYAVVKTPSGGTDFEYLTKAQAEEHKNRYALSKNGGPWKTAFDEMAKKSCIRKLAKRVPLSVEWVQAATLDEMADEGVPQMLAAAVVLDGDSGKPDLRERLDRAKAAPVEDDGIGEPPGLGEADGALFGNPQEMPKH